MYHGKLIVFLWSALLVMPVVYGEESEANTNEMSALDRRIKIERATRFQSFVITPHKPNYILPVSYNYIPNNSTIDVSRDGELDNNEIKFQFSMKFPIIDNVFGERG